MRQVNIHYAKTHFSELVAAVEAGEEIVVARAGKPVLRLVKEQPLAGPKRQPGWLKGKIRYAPGWDEESSKAEISAMLQEAATKPFDHDR